VFFSIGAGYVAERGLVLEGTELRQRNLASGIAVGRDAEQGGLLGHGMLGGMLRMVRHLNGLGGVGHDGSGLSESRGSAEKAQKTESADCGLHKIHPVRGTLLTYERTGGMPD
jgi:hypothetical protein